MNKINLETFSLKTFSLKTFARLVREYVGAVRVGRGRVDSVEGLGEFLDGRASYVAQTALYGYMKTRAGTRFPALFEDAGMLASINIAKWQIWLACLSDLTVYSGVLIGLHTHAPSARVREVLVEVVEAVLVKVGEPADAGEDFADGVRAVRGRIAGVDLEALRDDESAFTESPRALVYWAPIADELKRQDVEIVRNSVRFRWQEIRRIMRRRLDAEAVMRSVVG